jgi:hypothetical protein
MTQFLAGLLRIFSDRAPKPKRELHDIRGFQVIVENTRPDIESSAVLERLDDALSLIERYQPHRYRHLKRDLAQIWIARFRAGAPISRRTEPASPSSPSWRVATSPLQSSRRPFCTKVFTHEWMDFDADSARLPTLRTPRGRNAYVERRKSHSANRSHRTSAHLSPNARCKLCHSMTRPSRQPSIGKSLAPDRISPTAISGRRSEPLRERVGEFGCR